MINYIKFLLRSGKLYSDAKVRDIVLNSENPRQELDEYFSKEERQDAKRARKEKRKCQDKLGDKRQEVEELRRRVEDLKELDERLPKLRDKFNSKHSRRGVTYRRPLWNGNELEKQSIPVVNYITPHDPVIERRLEDAGLSIDDPLEADKVIPEIYELAKENYDYEFDRNNMGWVEFWQFPFETREYDGDCEDWAINIASYLIAAGLPSFRVRVVAGGTLDENYGGHATVYVLGDDMETWHHLNSTSPDYRRDSLDEYPEWGSEDAAEGLGIDPNDVWFAFNDKYSWQDFETHESKAKFEKSDLSDKINTV